MILIDLEWDLGDRLKKSLKASGVSVQDMANYLGVARETVSNWIAERQNPSKATLIAWSIRTGVPLEWIESGEVRPEGFEPPAY